MKYKVVNDSTIIPAINDFKGYGRFIHGVVTREHIDEKYLTLTRHEKSLLKENLRNEFISSYKEEVDHINGTYLYLGAVPSHFGHLLAEGAHRLWILQRYKETVFNGAIILRDEKGSDLYPKQIQLLNYFNIDLGKVKFIENITTINKLVLPEPGCTIGTSPVEGYDNFLRDETRFKKLDMKNKPEKIFVSRKKFKHVGRVAGFDFIADILSRNGYFEFKPEDYPLITQLEYLKAAKEIIWEEGSAIHLLDILPQLSSKMVLIRRRADYGEFDEIIKNKSADFEIYKNIKFIESSAVPHNRMSRLKSPSDFFMFLENNNINITSSDLDSFIREEFIDIQEQLHRDLIKLIKEASG